MKLIFEFDSAEIHEIDGNWTFETAAALIEILDNAEAYMGADAVLIDDETGKQYYFCEEKWEEVA